MSLVFFILVFSGLWRDRKSLNKKPFLKAGIKNPPQPSLKGGSKKKKKISPPLGGVRGGFKWRLKTF